jgi:hypothetical protein
MDGTRESTGVRNFSFYHVADGIEMETLTASIPSLIRHCYNWPPSLWLFRPRRENRPTVSRWL